MSVHMWLNNFIVMEKRNYHHDNRNAFIGTATHADNETRPITYTHSLLEPPLGEVTLVAILASLCAERNGSPKWLILIFNVTSYVAGGLYGAKGAIESIKLGRIDADLLMILAAICVALIDQWHE